MRLYMFLVDLVQRIVITGDPMLQKIKTGFNF